MVLVGGEVAVHHRRDLQDGCRGTNSPQLGLLPTKFSPVGTTRGVGLETMERFTAATSCFFMRIPVFDNGPHKKLTNLSLCADIQ